MHASIRNTKSENSDMLDNEGKVISMDVGEVKKGVNMTEIHCMDYLNAHHYFIPVNKIF